MDRIPSSRCINRPVAKRLCCNSQCRMPGPKRAYILYIITLSFLHSPYRTVGMVEQTGGYNFSIKGKNKKLNSSLSNQVHNSPLLLNFCQKLSIFYFGRNALVVLLFFTVHKPKNGSCIFCKFNVNTATLLKSLRNLQKSVHSFKVFWINCVTL